MPADPPPAHVGDQENSAERFELPQYEISTTSNRTGPLSNGRRVPADLGGPAGRSRAKAADSRGLLRQGREGADESVAFCILRKKETGERFLSVKRRETVNNWLDEFAAEQGWAGKQAVTNANVVRSFLIHNGVFIQGPVWRG